MIFSASDYDVSNNRIYLLGSKSMDRDKDKKIVNDYCWKSL